LLTNNKIHKKTRSEYMKTTTLTVAAAAIVMFAQSAHAREYHHRHHHQHHMAASRGASGRSESAVAYRGRDRGRPAAWCGWEMRRLVGADPGPSYNLARNWAHWGRPGAAGVGAVVVWPHHVGKIVGRENGQWIIESGNDGHALRSRARSIVGAIAIRWS
jgi:hypothetical protein